MEINALELVIAGHRYFMVVRRGDQHLNTLTDHLMHVLLSHGPDNKLSPHLLSELCRLKTPSTLKVTGAENM
jgi:hypothetical protein